MAKVMVVVINVFIFYQIGISQELLNTKNNSQGNIQITLNNQGQIGYNRSDNKGTLYYPKGSGAKYLWGSGIYFGAKKDSTYLLTTNFDLNTGTSYFVPGKIYDGLGIDSSNSLKYEVQSSNDYNKKTGKHLTNSSIPAWSVREYRNNYLVNEAQKEYLKPFFIGDEDLVASYKDTDLNYYPEYLRKYGYIGLEVVTTLSIKTNNSVGDYIINTTRVINKSTKVLNEFFFSTVWDADISQEKYQFMGQKNDYLKVINTQKGSILSFYSDSSNFERKAYFHTLNIMPFDKITINGKKLNYGFYEVPTGTSLLTYEDFYNIKKEDNFNTLDKRMAYLTEKFTFNPNDTLEFIYVMYFSRKDNPKNQLTASDENEIMNKASILNNTLNEVISSVDLTEYEVKDILNYEIDYVVFDIKGREICKNCYNDLEKGNYIIIQTGKSYKIIK